MKKYVSKKRLRDISDVRFCLVDSSDKHYDDVKWITVSNLLPNNVVEGFDDSIFALPSEMVKIKKDDIVIRRIAPTYINIISDIGDGYYAFNNLIILRANEQIDAYYLAYYLDTYIEDIIRRLKKGTVMPTLTRSDIEEIEVPIPSMAEQQALGRLWYLSGEKKKLLERLFELDNKKIKYILQNHIKNSEDK